MEEAVQVEPVAPAETIPEPVGRWHVEGDADGAARRFAMQGGWEVWLSSDPLEDGRRQVIALRFATKAAATQAAHWFNVAFALQDIEAPDPATCTHEKTALHRYSRSLPPVRQCDLCNAVIEEATA